MNGIPLFRVLDALVAEESVFAFDHALDCPAAPGRACRAELVLRRFATAIGDRLEFSPSAVREAAYTGLKACAACGKPVSPSWSFSGCLTRLWRREDGDPLDLRSAPESFGHGAAWESPWLARLFESYWDNWPEGRAPLQILTPGGVWMPDSRANNCTLPNEKTHRCWVLHGDGLRLTADKAGHTCSAGAGSILAGGWHGFLRDGMLVS